MTKDKKLFEYDRAAVEKQLEESEQKTEYPDVWQFQEEKDPILVGLIRDIRTAPTKFGDMMVLEIEWDVDKRYSVFCPTVLARQVEQSKASVNDLVAIKYLGKKKTPGSMGEYHDFSFTVLEQH